MKVLCHHLHFFVLNSVVSCTLVVRLQHDSFLIPDLVESCHLFHQKLTSLEKPYKDLVYKITEQRFLPQGLSFFLSGWHKHALENDSCQVDVEPAEETREERCHSFLVPTFRATNSLSRHMQGRVKVYMHPY